MSFIQKTASLTVTTAADGTQTAYLPNVTNDGPGQTITGRIVAIHYTAVDYDATVDFTITVESTGEGLWTESNVTASKSVYPSKAIHDSLGAAQTVTDIIRLVNDRVKIVLAQGGNAKTGKFIVEWE